MKHSADPQFSCEFFKKLCTDRSCQKSSEANEANAPCSASATVFLRAFLHFFISLFLGSELVLSKKMWIDLICRKEMTK